MGSLTPSDIMMLVFAVTISGGALAYGLYTKRQDRKEEKAK